MTFMLIFSAAVIASLLLSGHAKTMKANDWLAVAIALIGVNFMRGGNWIAGPALIAGAAFWRGSFFWDSIKANWGKQDRKPKRRDFEVDRARALLGVDDRADSTTINNAWRQRLSEHHPDRGGDEQLARQINRARDILLEQLEAGAQA